MRMPWDREDPRVRGPQDNPRGVRADRLRDSIQDRPRHEVQSRLRDRSPREKIPGVRFDPDLEETLDRPRTRHPFDDPNRNKTPKPRKWKRPEIDFEDPLPVNDLEEVIPGVYRTPDEPVDPRNCNLWPDSPWCGGNPWGWTPVGFEPKIVADECTIGLRVQPILGYTNMPPIEIQYRRPGKCREKEEPEIPDQPSPPPINWPPGNLAEPCVAAIVYRQDIWIRGFDYTGKLINEERGSNWIKASGFEPCITIYEQNYGQEPIPKRIPLQYREKYGFKGNRKYFYDRWYYDSWSEEFDEYIAWAKYWEKYENLIETMEEANKDANYLITYINGDPFGRPYFEGFKLVKTQFEIEAFYQPVCVEKSVPPPPHPPQPLPCKCMGCCNNNNNNLDDLKALINELSEKMGVDNFPAKAPAWLNALNQRDIEINSMPEYLAYIVRQMDAILGSFPIKIKIKDSDLTKEGNQEVSLDIPNLAEGIAELLGLALTTRTETDAILNAVIRNLVETGSTRQQAFLAYQLAMANAEFLGYNLKQKPIKVPFAFTPGKTKLDQILKESEQTIVGFENADDQDIRDLITPLLELAAMWKAQNFKRVDPIHTAADILSILKDGKRMYDQYNKIKDGKKGGEEEEEEWDNSWDEFQRQVEQGWTQTPGISDNLKPYGRNYSERPKIRELGDTSDGDTNAN